MTKIWPSDLPEVSRVLFLRDESGITCTVEPNPAMDGNTYVRAAKELFTSDDWGKCLDALNAAGWGVEPVAEVRIVGDMLCQLSRLMGGNHSELPNSSGVSHPEYPDSSGGHHATQAPQEGPSDG